jgi:hypothetical protein
LFNNDLTKSPGGGFHGEYGATHALKLVEPGFDAVGVIAFLNFCIMLDGAEVGVDPPPCGAAVTGVLGVPNTQAHWSPPGALDIPSSYQCA